MPFLALAVAAVVVVFLALRFARRDAPPVDVPDQAPPSLIGDEPPRRGGPIGSEATGGGIGEPPPRRMSAIVSGMPPPLDDPRSSPSGQPAPAVGGSSARDTRRLDARRTGNARETNGKSPSRDTRRLDSRRTGNAEETPGGTPSRDTRRLDARRTANAEETPGGSPSRDTRRLDARRTGPGTANEGSAAPPSRGPKPPRHHEASRHAPPSPGAPVDLEQVKALVRAGQRINAIALYRAHTGVSVEQARAAVDALHAGHAPPPPGAPVDLGQVKALIRSDQLISAIKLYREQTGTSLAEARDVVEALRDGRAPPPREPRHDEPARPALDLTAIATLAREGQMIQAIKLYRELSGLGLKKAKEDVEALRDGRPRPHGG